LFLLLPRQVRECPRKTTRFGGVEAATTDKLKVNALISGGKTMQKASYLICALTGAVSSWALAAHGQSAGEVKQGAIAGRSSPVASVTLPGGHRVDFFAPPGGPIAIAEVGPKGSARVVDEETIARKKPSEIYTMLKGAGARPPAALLRAESRLGTLRKPRARPTPKEGQAGPGPDDTADQVWFKNTYCTQYWQCVQGWSWANTSSGHNQGRGYMAYALNGSEAQAPRNLETDWWNGSSWASLVTESMPAGWQAWTSGGNTGGLLCSNPTWYFRSEVLDNGTGDGATVSLADHMYASGGGGHIDCYNVPPCPCSCGCACPAGRGGGNYVTCGTVSQCVNSGTGSGTVADDYCVNPP
jgi:hypothetical protein